MNNKTLIGSIIAVVLLTLVSFSSVVGYSSVKSDLKIASPLFSIKNNKGEVSSDYIGEGKEINIPLPKRNDEAGMIEKFINIIKSMDDNTFDRFVDLTINQLHQKDNYQVYDEDEIVLSLKELRDNPNEIKPYILNGKNTKLWTLSCETMGCTLELNRFCISLFLMIIIMSIINTVIMLISIPLTLMFNCF